MSINYKQDLCSVLALPVLTSWAPFFLTPQLFLYNRSEIYFECILQDQWMSVKLQKYQHIRCLHSDLNITWLISRRHLNLSPQHFPPASKKLLILPHFTRWYKWNLQCNYLSSISIRVSLGVPSWLQILPIEMGYWPKNSSRLVSWLEQFTLTSLQYAACCELSAFQTKWYLTSQISVHRNTWKLFFSPSFNRAKPLLWSLSSLPDPFAHPSLLLGSWKSLSFSPSPIHSSIAA